MSHSVTSANGQVIQWKAEGIKEIISNTLLVHSSFLGGGGEGGLWVGVGVGAYSKRGA